MTPERWGKVTELFQSASEMSEEERIAFLDLECQGDEGLRREVESLLAAGTQVGDFIQEPIVGTIDPKDGDPIAALSPGETLGHYKIEKAIGFGGMGEVYLANDTKLNRSVALKILPLHFVKDKGFLRRFRNEALAAATLNHPNVATVYAVEEYEGRPFIAMEFVDGQSLRSLLTKDGLPLEKFLAWFEPIADAFAHAHEKGVTHRDIKPGNIMISRSGTPKILDFGLAQMDAAAHEASTLHDLTAPGQIIGTPSYMSPEQAEGRTVDHRSDIFSLGIVMYEALCGSRPFQGENYGDVVREIVASDPRPISYSRQEIPSGLAFMIEKCLKKAPTARISSMSEIRSILGSFRSDTGEPRSMDSFVRRFYREAAASSQIWVGAAALLIVLLSIAAWYMFSSPAEPTFSIDAITLKKLSQSSNVVYAGISPDGNSLVYNTIEEGGQRSMWIRPIGERNALQLLGPRPAQFWGGLTISKDGNSIYYITAELAERFGTLYRISALGGPPRKLIDGVNDLGSLSPEGDRLLVVRYGPNTQILSVKSVDGSDEKILLAGDGDTLFRDPQYSADGRSIFAIRFDRLDGVEYWSLIQFPSDGGPETVVIPRQKPKISEIVALANGRELLLNLTDPISNLPQIYNFSLDEKRLSRVTNDLNSYFGLSADLAARQIVTSQREHEKRIWVGDFPSSSMQPLQLETNIYSTVKWTPDGRLVFDAIDNNRPHIYIVDSDGRNVQQLTPGESSDFRPRVTPDGRFVVFTSDRSGENRIWRMNLDGSSPTQISPNDYVAESNEISGDGTNVYFSFLNGEKRGTARISIDGGGFSLMQPSTEQYWVPSNDGRSVAFTYLDKASDRFKLAIAAIGSSEPDKILEAWPTFILKWAPDNESVLYREREAGEVPYSILWQHNVRTDERRKILDVSPEVLMDVDWSADRKRLAVVRERLLTDAVLLSTVEAEQTAGSK